MPLQIKNPLKAEEIHGQTEKRSVPYKSAFIWKLLINPLWGPFCPFLLMTKGLTKSTTKVDWSLSLHECVSTRWTKTSVRTSTDFTVRLLIRTWSWGTCSAQSNNASFCAHACVHHIKVHSKRQLVVALTGTPHFYINWFRSFFLKVSPLISVTSVIPGRKKNKAVITAREQQSHGELADARMLLKFNEKWQLEKFCFFRKKEIGFEEES